MGCENKCSSGGGVTAVLAVLGLVALVAWLVIKLATSGMVVSTDAVSKEAVAARLKPVGLSVAGEGGAPGSRSGEAIYKSVCAACHAAGLIGAPKFADNGAWAGRIAQGFDTLVKNATNGLRAMPAKGGTQTRAADHVKGGGWGGDRQARFEQGLTRRVLPDTGGQHLTHNHFADLFGRHACFF